MGKLGRSWENQALPGSGMTQIVSALQQVFDRIGLRQKPASPRLKHHLSIGGQPADGDDFDLGVHGLELADGGDAVHVGHHHVDQHKLDVVLMLNVE